MVSHGGLVTERPTTTTTVEAKITWFNPISRRYCAVIHGSTTAGMHATAAQSTGPYDEPAEPGTEAAQGVTAQGVTVAKTADGDDVTAVWLELAALQSAKVVLKRR